MASELYYSKPTEKFKYTMQPNNREKNVYYVIYKML